MRDQIYSVGDLRAIIAPIAARHGVERIYLFGSYARGEATKNSDNRQSGSTVSGSKCRGGNCFI